MHNLIFVKIQQRSNSFRRTKKKESVIYDNKPRPSHRNQKENFIIDLKAVDTPR